MHWLLSCVKAACTGRIDLYYFRSIAVQVCYLILWFMFLFVLNVAQCKRALSRRAEETEATSNKENKYLHWYLYTLFCTLCYHKVSRNLCSEKMVRKAGH